ncbi:MAG: response regulator [Eubacteriales bacterium]
MKKLIYVADDEVEILDVIKVFLVHAGYHVKTFTSGDQLYLAFQLNHADLVILDIMMPGTDGLTICTKVREISNVPIIMVSAKNSEADFSAECGVLDSALLEVFWIMWPNSEDSLAKVLKGTKKVMKV